METSFCEIKIDGETYTFGKADMTKTSTLTGEPVRLQSQINKLEKKNPDAVIQCKVIFRDKKISTIDLKKVETNYIQEFIIKNILLKTKITQVQLYKL